MQNFFPAYRITISDLPRIKAVAARVFGREVPTQTRLEIIARGAGFTTYAGFLNALHKAPILLTGDQEREQRYISTSVPETVCLPFYKGVSLTDLVAAGLAWPERLNTLEAIQQTPEEKLSILKKDTGTDTDFLHFMWKARTSDTTRKDIYMSSVPRAEAQARFSTTLVVVVSPSNQRSYTNEDMAYPWLAAQGQHTPGSEEWIKRGGGQELSGMTPHSIQKLLRNTRVCLFDAQDLADFLQFLDGLGLGTLNLHTRILKPMMLDIQRKTHGTFRCMAADVWDTRDEDSDPRDADWTGKRSIEGLFDMADQVMGVAYERHRMQMGGQGPSDDRFYFDPLLIADY
jgi:hypothetical protein